MRVIFNDGVAPVQINAEKPIIDWAKVDDVYLQWGINEYSRSEHITLAQAFEIANNNPEITHFFYVAKGTLSITYFDFASNGLDQKHFQEGCALFFSGLKRHIWPKHLFNGANSNVEVSVYYNRSLENQFRYEEYDWGGSWE